MNLPNITGILETQIFNATGIEHIVSLGSITEIKNSSAELYGTFSNCKSLQDAVLPDTLETIGNYAFMNCTSLTNINIPESVTTIGQNAFYGTNLSMDITDKLLNITSIGQNAFGNCSNVTGEVNLPLCKSIKGFQGTAITGIKDISSATEIGAYAFTKTNLTTVTIPETVTSIGISCFDGCSNLEIDLSNLSENITTLSVACFRNCSKMIGIINLPNLESVGSFSFGYTGITKVTSLGQVTNIPDDTFQGCSELRYVELPNTITNIGAHSFQGCSKLKVIKIYADVPPTTTNNPLQYINKIYVPDDSVEAYRSASGWTTLADKIHPMSEYAEGEEDEVTE